MPTNAAPTVIDLSSLPAPNAIEPLDYPTLKSAFLTQFQTLWAAVRAANPSLNLPAYDVQALETDPVVVVGEAWSYNRLLDRARVNDAVRAVLAPLAQKADLDNIVASAGIQRLLISPATTTAAAVYENDAQLLRRYLLAFDKPSAGSADRYLFEAFTAVPDLQDATVNGYAVHGRPGDVDIVIAGAAGATATTSQVATVLAACSNTSVKPEATRVSVIAATRSTYTANLGISIPRGPDASLVVAAAAKAVNAIANARLCIGSQVPMDAIAGAAYVPNVIFVDRSKLPADVAPDPYAIPVMTGLTILPTVIG